MRNRDDGRTNDFLAATTRFLAALDNLSESDAEPLARCLIRPMTPREDRAASALLMGEKTREAIDRVTGASNGPDVIAKMRAMGLEIPCRLVPFIDADGRPSRYGVYELTDRDRRILRWLRAWRTCPAIRSRSWPPAGKGGCHG